MTEAPSNCDACGKPRPDEAPRRGADAHHDEGYPALPATTSVDPNQRKPAAHTAGNDQHNTRLVVENAANFFRHSRGGR